MFAILIFNFSDNNNPEAGDPQSYRLQHRGAGANGWRQQGPCPHPQAITQPEEKVIITVYSN